MFSTSRGVSNLLKFELSITSSYFILFVVMKSLRRNVNNLICAVFVNSNLLNRLAMDYIKPKVIQSSVVGKRLFLSYSKLIV